MIVHNTGGYESIEADNDYHKNKDWGGGARAPHIAYTFWVPRDWASFLADHGMSLPDNPPDGLVVWCNHLWERTWHATNANDSCVGIACQVDGEKDELNQWQKAAVLWLIDIFLPGQGIKIDRGRVWGHGETPKVYGGGPDFGNNTVCPGRYVLPWVRSLRGG